MVSASLAILLSAGVLCVAGGDEKGNASAVVKDESAVGTPWLPFLGFNSFSSFLPGLGVRPFPPVPAPQIIKATKTKYIEVTRRQTIHPMCYTMYENKAPCLPQRSAADDDQDMDMDVEHNISFLSDIKDEEVDSTIDMESYTKPMPGEERDGKYLRFVSPVRGKDPAQLDGSESRPVANASPNRQSTEYVATTTVLLTKLEKYTDRRVTATMVALNCAPTHPSIPRCRRRVANPIVEVPLYNIHTGNRHPIIITPALKLKAEPQDEDGEVEKTVDAVKKAAEAVRNQTETRLQELQTGEVTTEEGSVSRDAATETSG